MEYNMTTEIINSNSSLEKAIKLLRDTYRDKRWFTIELNTDKKCTGQQLKSVNLYCRMLADALNDAGFDMKVVLAHHPEISWTGPSVKEKIWRPVQLAQTNEVSTTRPSTKQYPVIYENINRFISGKFGVHVPWPSKEKD
jgi:hypothetical protein